MQYPTQQQDAEENTQEFSRAKRKYLILFLVKCGLGILLLILGGLAVKNTSGQQDTFGPPYFVGAFVVGCTMVLAGLLDIVMYRFLTSTDQDVLQQVAHFTCIEIILTGISIMGGLLGIFFVAIFGVPECDPSDFFSHCNYTINTSANRSLAVAILIFLLVSEVISIGSIVVHCRACKGLGPYNMLKPRGHRFANQQVVYGGVGAGNVVIATAPEPSPLHRAFGNNRNYDGYSADTQIIIDGNVIDKDKGGFSGAVIHPPQSNIVIHPPMGYPQPQFTGATGQSSQLGYNSGDSVSQLQEQNRLLREQIALQQQQLQLSQRLQQQEHSDSSSTMPAPPPSYDSCLQNPAQVRFLQEQNEELKNRYQSQQQQITQKIPLQRDSITTPSAPPM